MPKYEKVLGNQELFDGAPEDVILCVTDDMGNFNFYSEEVEGDWISPFLQSEYCQIALRRIVSK